MSSAPTPTADPDPRPALARAVGITDAVLATVQPDDLDRPTPCPDFDVRTLRRHLLTVVRRITIVLNGGRFDAVPHVTDVADEDFAGRWAAGRDELLAMLPGVDLARPVIAPFGTVPAGAAVGSYIGEFLVHSWDLTTVTGRFDLVDDELATAVLANARTRIPADGREHIPFGPVVDVPDDAPAIDRLVGWLGRDPHADRV